MLFRSFSDAELRLLAAACLTIPPVLTWRGNEGWKHLTGAIGLLLAMASLPGCLLMMDPKENLSGFAALLAFLLGCYTVKVFLINQPVKDYFPELQRKHHQPDRTAALVERSLQRAIRIAVYMLAANQILVFLRDFSKP